MKKLSRFTCATLLLLFATLACQGGPLGTFFATATPTATSTPTITPTFTPTNTPEPTLTPTPLPEGIQTNILNDDSTIFSDYDNLYRLTLPSTWKVLPADKEDFTKVIADLVEKNPEMAAAAENFKQMDTKALRMFALNQDPQHLQKGFASNLTTLVFEQEMLAGMPMAVLTAIMEEALEQQNAKVISQGYNAIKGKNGLEIGVVEAEKTYQSPNKGEITIRIRMLIFQVGSKLVTITLTSPTDVMEGLKTELDEIAKSIEIIQP